MPKKTNSTKPSIYETVTNQIVDLLESVKPGDYRTPWDITSVAGTGLMLPANATTGKSYRGVNTLILWCAAIKRGYASGQWATYKQWESLGGQVRRGEKSVHCVYWSKRTLEDKKADGSTEEREVFLALPFCVFNRDQVDNLPALDSLPQPSKPCAAIFSAVPVRIERDIKAVYYPRSDYIGMPPVETFASYSDYCSVLAHELAHWTGHETRLNRDIRNRFGTHAYAMEELIAELSSAYTLAGSRIAKSPDKSNAAYLKSWIDCLKSDSRAIFTVASKAQAATDLILSYSAEEASESEPDQAVA